MILSKEKQEGLLEWEIRGKIMVHLAKIRNRTIMKSQLILLSKISIL